MNTIKENGFDKSSNYKPIDRALRYMRDVLLGKGPSDGREKVLNWDAFEAHMMAA